MNIAATAFNHRVLVVVLSLLTVLAGYDAYQKLGRLEDPAFAIKQAVVVTNYPGASAREVADEVTNPIETAIQQLDQVDYITSRSRSGQSLITVYIKDRFRSDDLPQVWDELRRKVQAARAQLPPGAGEPYVNDDFGDVYGVLFYVYGDGFTPSELRRHVKMLRRELLLVKDVASVAILGEPREAIYVQVRSEQVARLGGSIQATLAALEGQGIVTPSGEVDAGELRLRVEPTGQLDSVSAIRQLVVTSRDGGTLRLGDIADVTRADIDPPDTLLRYNGYRAIAVGVSTAAGGNVVNMGDAVKRRLAELDRQTPVGIELGVVSMQSDSVRQAVSGFTLGLVESVVIVVGALLLAMGLRSGLLIGGILLLTILGTFVVMQVMSVDLQRISLGALIIALGMLVDNAIVVAEGMVAGSGPGVSVADAAKKTVLQTAWPLLGATIIAVLAFAPIGLSPDSTGDYCGSLFTVIWVSLLLSWVFAVTSTPVLGAMLLRPGAADAAADPYGGAAFRLFRGLLEGMLRWRWLAVLVLVVLLAVSVIGFGKARQGFFPSSARPQFMVEFLKPQGTSIAATDEEIAHLAAWVRTLPGVVNVATNIGSGSLRFELTYAPENPNPAYAQLLISVQDHHQIDGLMKQVRQRLDQRHPDAMGWPWRMVLGPGGEAKVQVRFRGPDADVLRALADKAEAVFAADPYVVNIRADWRQRTSVIQPVLDDTQAARLGLTRKDVSRTLQLALAGVNVGLYREGDDLIPVLLRAPQDEREGAQRLTEVMLAAAGGHPVPIDQVLRGTRVAWEDPLILRRNRVNTITVMCDPAVGGGPTLFARLRPQIEALPLPEGYTREWGGEFEKSSKANAGLTALMPVCFGGMVLILIALFGNLRQPAIILLTVPLGIIGVTVGLLTTGAEFGFMPILGVLSLTGMLIKNSIVLIDEANAQTQQGADPYTAILNSAVSRARPVVMAAVTTVLGMIPLLTDVFFKDMAIVIMFGLTFATVLTLMVVPLLYALMYRAYPQGSVAGTPATPRTP